MGMSPMSSIGASIIGALAFYFIAIVAGIVLHFTFLSSKYEGKFTGVLGQLYDFLTFRKLCIESILRVFYICTVCLLCAHSIITLFTGFSKNVNFGASLLAAILTLVFGNLLIRVIYELSLLSILMCRNIIDINKKMSALTGNKSESSPFDLSGGNAADNVFAQEKPVFCNNCGAQITRPGAEFCTKCGHKR